MEDTCGLGATGITGNTTLFQQFTRWANIWHKTGANYAILAFDGHDFDDPNYTTAPTGTFTGTTNRDYNFDGAYKMLKVKLVEVSPDGTNYYRATPIDDNDRQDISVKDTNVDSNFSITEPKYDLIANGFKLFPKFTAAQVSAGAKVYVEWYRAPRDFSTTGTDSYEPGFDLQFHRLPALGASLEYCKLYKPDLVPQLRLDLYGNGENIKGMLKDMEEWYVSKSPSNGRMKPAKENNR
ncbi:MAG: hypothetical protein ACLGJB_03690 [Blastocatellia bacterium]